MFDKASIAEQISHVRDALTATIENMTPEQFEKGDSESWSPSNYLKHLILSLKPFNKGFRMPPEQLEAIFSVSDRPSMSYDELVSKYTARLAEGVRAESYDSVMPTLYRFPEGVEDVKAYLVKVWNDTNNQLLETLQNWSESDLDRYQIPHPAVGMLTVREMLFFMAYHNTMHWQDIEKVHA